MVTGGIGVVFGGLEVALVEGLKVCSTFYQVKWLSLLTATTRPVNVEISNGLSY